MYCMWFKHFIDPCTAFHRTSHLCFKHPFKNPSTFKWSGWDGSLNWSPTYVKVMGIPTSWKDMQLWTLLGCKPKGIDGTILHTRWNCVERVMWIHEDLLPIGPSMSLNGAFDRCSKSHWAEHEVKDDTVCKRRKVNVLFVFVTWEIIWYTTAMMSSWVTISRVRPRLGIEPENLPEWYRMPQSDNHSYLPCVAVRVTKDTWLPSVGLCMAQWPSRFTQNHWWVYVHDVSWCSMPWTDGPACELVRPCNFWGGLAL